MRNRAKCKLCKQILESFTINDLVECNCGEISISGGLNNLYCSAKNWENFLRVDDEGNEIVVRVEGEPSETPKKLSKREKIDMLNDMLTNMEKLPSHALTAPITHYDFISFCMVLLSIVSDDCNADN